MVHTAHNSVVILNDRGEDHVRINDEKSYLASRRIAGTPLLTETKENVCTRIGESSCNSSFIISHIFSQ